MPELPEVETMRQCLTPVIGGRIVRVVRPRSRLRPVTICPPWPQFRRRLVGRTITGVDRLGKRIVITLDNGDCVVIEPRMSGLALLAHPPDAAHLRLVVELAGAAVAQMLFWDQRGLGVVRLLSAAEFAEHCGPERFGPDALTISCDELRSRLGSSRRAIKVALLDQRALVGIGNVYASELLHRAGVHPAIACRRLRRSDWERIHAAMREVLTEAIEHQGSTLRDGTYRVARNEAGNFQLCHRVYQRDGNPCVQCGRAEIVRIVQAQRSTFFCPRCQRPRRPA